MLASEAVENKRAAFPISDSTYFEVSKIRQYRQRRDLREVIERVSRYMVVTSRSVISVHEIEALLDQLIGPSPNLINAWTTSTGASLGRLAWLVASGYGQRRAKTSPLRSGRTTETVLRCLIESSQEPNWI
jgi:hypothetical protein